MKRLADEHGVPYCLVLIPDVVRSDCALWRRAIRNGPSSCNVNHRVGVSKRLAPCCTTFRARSAACLGAGGGEVARLHRSVIIGRRPATALPPRCDRRRSCCSGPHAGRGHPHLHLGLEWPRAYPASACSPPSRTPTALVPSHRPALPRLPWPALGGCWRPSVARPCRTKRRFFLGAFVTLSAARRGAMYFLYRGGSRAAG